MTMNTKPNPFADRTAHYARAYKLDAVELALIASPSPEQTLRSIKRAAGVMPPMTRDELAVAALSVHLPARPRRGMVRRLLTCINVGARAAIAAWRG